MKKQLKSFLYHLFLPGLILVMTACGPPAQNLAPTQNLPTTTQSSEIITPTSQPSSTPTSAPKNILTICTNLLPGDLFPYSNSTAVNKSNLLSLIYEEPFLMIDGELTPVILKKLPIQEEGDLFLSSVTVQAGQEIVDPSGQIRILKPGVKIRPSGCRDGDCVITWDGESALEMDQMVIEYQIREDLTWSDGVPVTAEDSVLSFELSADLKGSGLKWAVDRTARYQAIDQNQVQWRGLPGFTFADPSLFFWKPLPAHLFQDSFNWEELENDNLIKSLPVGYGPFTPSAWEDGILVLSRNENYFRAGEGLPRFDQIQVRLVEKNLGDAWLDLKNGECDTLDSTFDFFGSPGLIEEIQSNPNFDLLVQSGKSWTQLVFGIKPSSYDDFYTPELGDRLDYLGDARTRQAIMHCLDRDLIRESVKGELGAVWPSYLPGEESRLESGEWVNHDVQRGVELLQSVGWYDLDGDPETPLQSWYAPNVPGGAKLSLELLVDPNPYHQDIAKAIQKNLTECGVGVTIKTLPMKSLYAPGPEGPLFGRQFDLALISWQPIPGGDCQLYQSWHVPTDENYWIGTNIAGLLNERYDNACADAALALSDEKEAAVRQAELEYLNSLPAVPLFSIPKMMVVPASGCFDEGFSGEGEFFRSIANFGSDEMCP